MLYVLIFFSAIIFRYIVAAGVFFYYFYVLRYPKYRERRLSKRDVDVSQYKREILWSTTSAVIFAVAGALTYWLWQQGYAAIYLNVETYGYGYLVLSVLSAMLIHETYYYWTHRWMHRPKIFGAVHKVHHESLIPTPWTAFSFHPFESILEAIILPVILLIIPMHPLALGIYLLIMTISSVINHLDIEIYPEKLRRSVIGRWLIGATHHHLHHREFNTNYGLYFTFWDKWMKTENRRMK